MNFKSLSTNMVNALNSKSQTLLYIIRTQRKYSLPLIKLTKRKKKSKAILHPLSNVANKIHLLQSIILMRIKVIPNRLPQNFSNYLQLRNPLRKKNQICIQKLMNALIKSMLNLKSSDK